MTIDIHSISKDLRWVSHGPQQVVRYMLYITLMVTYFIHNPVKGIINQIVGFAKSRLARTYLEKKKYHMTTHFIMVFYKIYELKG